ncbi:MAG: SDR family NAD(P)-dependent oxidoreductase [Alphaproteobacteria bacterium]|nr:SDR family NAD(P)-dependent oxidoreductase [Alphaproteobacteria bacterium]
MSSSAAAGAVASRFGADSTALDVIEGIRLEGRTALVTGGASGIGLEIARALAAAGAAVVIADREVALAEKAAAELIGETGNARVAVAEVDLASLASVRLLAARFLERHDRLDILVNNAGIMACPQAYSADGHELHFAVNYLGHFALAVLLRDALARAAPSRVVSVSSIGHRRSPVVFEDIDYRRRPYERWEAYGQSKTACALLAPAITAQWSAQGIVCHAVNPGGSMTGLQRHLTTDELRALGWIDESGRAPARWRSPAQCAATSVWAATAPELGAVSGLYLENCQVAAPWRKDQPMSGVHDYATSPALAARLWAVSRAMADL